MTGRRVTKATMNEAAHQRLIVALLRLLGWSVYSLSQGYRKEKGGTRMTPGIPDLYAFHRHKRLTLWVEVKPPAEMRRLDRLLERNPLEVPKSAKASWRRAVAQQQFGDLCDAVGQSYVRGGVEDVTAYLHTLGFKIGQA